MQPLDYESKLPGEEPGGRWGWLAFFLIGVSILPIVWPQIVSPHGMSEWDMRFFKILVLIGFVAAYLLTRVGGGWVRVVGWLFFIGYILLIVLVAGSVVDALAG